MANEMVLTPRGELIKQVENKLSSLLAEQTNAFPKNFNQTRFLQNCMAVLIDTKEIEKCKPISIVRTLIKGAYLGLDFFRKECYAIPYADVLTFQTGYIGEIKLAKRYGTAIQDIYAKIVQEGDELEINIVDGRQSLNFKPKAFNDGKIVGAFAVVIFKDGTTRYETMSVKEIEDIRTKFSKAPNSPAWQKSYGEMCKKVVLRRVCKMIDLNFDNQEQQKAYEEGSDSDVRTDKPEAVAPKVSDPFNDEQAPAVVVAEAVIVDADSKLRADLKTKFPNEANWQINARIREIKEAKR